MKHIFSLSLPQLCTHQRVNVLKYFYWCFSGKRKFLENVDEKSPVNATYRKCICLQIIKDWICTRIMISFTKRQKIIFNLLAFWGISAFLSCNTHTCRWSNWEILLNVYQSTIYSFCWFSRGAGKKTDFCNSKGKTMMFRSAAFEIATVSIIENKK